MPSIRVISKLFLMKCRTSMSLCVISSKLALEILPISLKRSVGVHQKLYARKDSSQINQEQFELVADEVTDSANWEQLAIVVQYVKDDRPVERLLECVKCPNICGATIADLIIKALNEVGQNMKKCRAQTYYGAGNMAGKQQGVANQLKLNFFFF